jgi:hypothetical protein
MYASKVECAQKFKENREKTGNYPSLYHKSKEKSSSRYEYLTVNH